MSLLQNLPNGEKKVRHTGPAKIDGVLSTVLQKVSTSISEQKITLQKVSPQKVSATKGIGPLAWLT